MVVLATTTAACSDDRGAVSSVVIVENHGSTVGKSDLFQPALRPVFVGCGVHKDFLSLKFKVLRSRL